MIDPVTQNAAVAVQQLEGRVPGAWDYSPQSLPIVDRLLSAFAAHSGQLLPKLIENLVQMVSCYVLEVGRRQHGGQYAWYPPGQCTVLVVGEPKFRIAFSPYDAVRQRLLGSPLHATETIYRAFSNSVATATPGTSAAWGIVAAPPR